jgi:hypothetical protein
MNHDKGVGLERVTAGKWDYLVWCGQISDDPPIAAVRLLALTV